MAKNGVILASVEVLLIEVAIYSTMAEFSNTNPESIIASSINNQRKLKKCISSCERMLAHDFLKMMAYIRNCHLNS
ncbi:hypothetical protein AAHE18_03G250500 [Arachis hypogaea]